jgi:hypothetical protein
MKYDDRYDRARRTAESRSLEERRQLAARAAVESTIEEEKARTDNRERSYRLSAETAAALERLEQQEFPGITLVYAGLKKRLFRPDTSVSKPGWKVFDTVLTSQIRGDDIHIQTTFHLLADGTYLQNGHWNDPTPKDVEQLATFSPRDEGPAYKIYNGILNGVIELGR